METGAPVEHHAAWSVQGDFLYGVVPLAAEAVLMMYGQARVGTPSETGNAVAEEHPRVQAGPVVAGAQVLLPPGLWQEACTEAWAPPLLLRPKP